MAGIITSKRYALVFILVIAPVAISDDQMPIPSDKSMINKWFADNIKPYTDRKATLDPLLFEAEANPKTIKVRKDGSGDFKTVTEAVNSIPSGNKQRVNVDIGEGVYHEKIIINRTKPFVTFLGSPGKRPTLQFDGNAAKTMYSASVLVEGDYFIAYNIIFKNSNAKPTPTTVGAMAEALRLAADKSALYKTDVLGHQDTLCDHSGRHFFLDCHIAGQMDFIFGKGKSLYLRTNLHAIDRQGVTIISAQAKESPLADAGYSFVHCNVTGEKKDNTLLGRYWKNYPEVVYSYTSMSDVVKPEAWENTKRPDLNKDIIFGEYKNSGPGSNVAKRSKISKQLDEAQAKKYLNLGYIEASKWLLPPPLAKI